MKKIVLGIVILTLSQLTTSMCYAEEPKFILEEVVVFGRLSDKCEDCVQEVIELEDIPVIMTPKFEKPEIASPNLKGE